jgi:mannose/fructose-specific phosphotransferase system component IIA
MNRPVPALLVMHADLSAALMRAAATVYGPVEGLEMLSNESLSKDALEAAIEERVSRWAEGGLVFTDFFGGSCHLCGARAAHDHRDVIVISGINLPILIDYLHNREAYGVRELAERLLRKGQDSIRLQISPAA